MLIKDPKERRRVAEIKYLRALFWLLGWKYTSSDILRSLLSPRGVARLRKFGLIETQKKYFASVVQLSTFGWNFVSELFLSNKQFNMWSEETRELFQKLTRRNKKTVNWAKLHHDLKVQETVIKLLKNKLKPRTLFIYEEEEDDPFRTRIKKRWEPVEDEKPVGYLSEYSFFRLGYQPATDAIFVSFNENSEKPSIWGIEFESGQNRNIKRIIEKITSVVNNLILDTPLLNGIVVYGSMRNYQKAFSKLQTDLIKTPEQERVLFDPTDLGEHSSVYYDHYMEDVLPLYNGTIRGYEFYQPQPRNLERDFVIDVSKAFWPNDPSDFDKDLLRKLFTHLQ